jgi:hypothetical protein
MHKSRTSALAKLETALMTHGRHARPTNAATQKKREPLFRPLKFAALIDAHRSTHRIWRG